MARIFTSRIRPSGRSRVVFINARFPEIWFSVKICLEIVPLLTGNLRDNLNQRASRRRPDSRPRPCKHCAASLDFNRALHDTKPRKLPGILSRWKIDDVEVERELAFVRLGFAQPSFSPVPCQIGRGLECRDIYLSGKIERFDHIRNTVRAENRRARHDVKVEMRPGAVSRISQFS